MTQNGLIPIPMFQTCSVEWLNSIVPKPTLKPASLAVPIRKLPDAGPDWEEKAADMLAAIAGLTDPADTATNGRFKCDNRDTLEQMQQADCSAWSAVEQSLGDRDRELREQRNE